MQLFITGATGYMGTPARRSACLWWQPRHGGFRDEAAVYSRTWQAWQG